MIWVVARKKSGTQTPKPRGFCNRRSARGGWRSGAAPAGGRPALGGDAAGAPPKGDGDPSPDSNHAPVVSVCSWGFFLNFPAKISSTKHRPPRGSPEIYPPPDEHTAPAAGSDPVTDGCKNTTEEPPGCSQESSHPFEPRNEPSSRAGHLLPARPRSVRGALPAAGDGDSGTGVCHRSRREQGGNAGEEPRHTGGPQDGRGRCASQSGHRLPGHRRLGSPCAAELPEPPCPANAQRLRAGGKGAPGLSGGGGSALCAQELQSIPPGPLLPLPCPLRARLFPPRVECPRGRPRRAVLAAPGQTPGRANILSRQVLP